MNYFKDKFGKVFAFDDDQVKAGYSSSFAKMSPSEIQIHLNPEPTADQMSLMERVWRDGELLLADIELNKIQDGETDARIAESQWREYRKALRAWPANKDFPNKDKRPLSPRQGVV